jgi:hypothetical protein
MQNEKSKKGLKPGQPIRISAATEVPFLDFTLRILHFSSVFLPQVHPCLVVKLHHSLLVAELVVERPHPRQQLPPPLA